jgi:hypothetical protein
VVAQAILDTAAAATAAASGGLFGTGLSGGIAASGVVAVAAQVREGAQLLQIAAQTTAQVSAATASFERRSQEWELQRQLAVGEMAIGAQQVTLAQTHRDVARQEEFISRSQHDQAQATVEFLANKFTSAELYSWMSGILGGAYNYFLQQATAMASWRSTSWPSSARSRPRRSSRPTTGRPPTTRHSEQAARARPIVRA